MLISGLILHLRSSGHGSTDEVGVNLGSGPESNMKSYRE